MFLCLVVLIRAAYGHTVSTVSALSSGSGRNSYRSTRGHPTTYGSNNSYRSYQSGRSRSYRRNSEMSMGSYYSRPSYQGSSNPRGMDLPDVLVMRSICMNEDIGLLYPLKPKVEAAVECNPLRAVDDFSNCVQSVFDTSALSEECGDCLLQFVDEVFSPCWAEVQSGAFSRSKCIRIITQDIRNACFP